MSSINDLIKKLCPNGVEFKKVWEVTSWDKKYNTVDKSMQPRIIKYNYLLASKLDELVDINGDVLILETGINNKKYTTEKLANGNLCEGEIIAIPWGGTPNVKYYNGKFITGDNRIAISNDDKVLNTKFLYYLFNNRMDEISDFYRGSGIKHPEMKKILMMDIPIPPIEVQEEIVRILDKFGELEAELEARKNQYEFWRGKLLNDGTELVKLKEICSYSNNRISYDKLSEDNYVGVDNLLQNKKGKTKSYHVPTSGNSTKFEKNDILIGNIRPYLRKIWFADCCGGTNGDVLDIRVNDTKKIYPRFLYYVLSSESFFEYNNSNSKGAKMPRGDKQAIMNYEFIVPSIEKQIHIASILDIFDKLVNDISEGIPAEIELRKKQYEYYRNKLLNFEELKNE